MTRNRREFLLATGATVVTGLASGCSSFSKRSSKESDISSLQPVLDELRTALTGPESPGELLDDWDFRYACHIISDTSCNRYGLYDATSQSAYSPIVTQESVQQVIENTDGEIYIARVSFSR